MKTMARTGTRMSDLTQIISEGLTYDIAKSALTSILVASGLTFIAGRVFKKLENRKDVIYFSTASFFIVFVLIFIMAPRSQGPLLGGGVQSINAGGLNNDHDTVAVIAVGIQNSGSMQSITKNWSVEAKVNNSTYQELFWVPAPKSFTFKLRDEDIRQNDPTSPISITYHDEDNLLDKTVNPIPSRGLVEGILFVIFRR